MTVMMMMMMMIEIICLSVNFSIFVLKCCPVLTGPLTISAKYYRANVRRCNFHVRGSLQTYKKSKEKTFKLRAKTALKLQNKAATALERSSKTC